MERTEYEGTSFVNREFLDCLSKRGGTCWLEMRDGRMIVVHEYQADIKDWTKGIYEDYYRT